MKRNNDLIRMVLRAVEAQATGDKVVTLRPEYFRPMFPELTDEVLDEHVRMLADAGFIEAEPHQLGWFILRLTWEGHNFVQNSRDETVWNKTKSVAGHFALDVFASALKETAMLVIKSNLGIIG